MSAKPASHRAQEGEINGVLDVLLVGEEGHQAVDAHPPAGDGRHAVFHAADAVLVEGHGLFVAREAKALLVQQNHQVRVEFKFPIPSTTRVISSSV